MRQLSKLELDGLEILMSRDDIDHDTFCEMTSAVLALIHEVRERRLAARVLREKGVSP